MSGFSDCMVMGCDLEMTWCENGWYCPEHGTDENVREDCFVCVRCDNCNSDGEEYCGPWYNGKPSGTRPCRECGGSTWLRCDNH